MDEPCPLAKVGVAGSNPVVRSKEAALIRSNSSRRVSRTSVEIYTNEIADDGKCGHHQLRGRSGPAPATAKSRGNTHNDAFDKELLAVKG